MYGLCLLTGIFAAVLIGEQLSKRRGLDTQEYWRAVFFTLLCGLVGARLYHVIHRFAYFSQRPWEVIAWWQGGLGIWGAVLGGLLGLFWATRKSGRFLAFADIFAVGAPLAQGIGRWGNYFNKELFGFPSNLPWSIYIPRDLRPAAFSYYDRFHPLFLYESLLDLMLFVLLYKLFNRRQANSEGIIVLWYLIGYSTIRFFLEFLRPNPWRIFGFPVGGIFSLVVFFTSIFLLARGRRGYDNPDIPKSRARPGE